MSSKCVIWCNQRPQIELISVIAQRRSTACSQQSSSSSLPSLPAEQRISLTRRQPQSVTPVPAVPSEPASWRGTEVKPVTSGYRLALSCNLIHTTQNLRPALSANNTVIAELDSLLKRWRRDEGGAPDKVAYLLEYKYSQANLNGSALKGADAHKVAVLSTLANKYGFSLGLASVSCKLSGSCEGDVYDDEDGYNPFYGYSRSSDAKRHRNLEFEEVYDRQTTLEYLVALDGRLLATTLQHEDDEIFPEDIAENVEDHVDCDKEEYEGYQGNVRPFIHKLGANIDLTW